MKTTFFFNLIILTFAFEAFAAGTNLSGVTSTDPQVLARRVTDRRPSSGS
jgi:hypothetical protein